MKRQKTNAARLLDTAGTPYELVPYEADENDLSAAHLSAQLGEEGGSVFKTLVLSGERTGHFVCVIPGDAELDLKKAARASGNKKCELIPVKELFAVTGYVRGGCSPLGMKKHFPTFLDEQVWLWDAIHVSAGQRGLQLRIAPADLLEQAEATECDLCADRSFPTT